MKRRIALIIGILLICIRVSAQPPEITYYGTLAHAGDADDELAGPYNLGFAFSYYGNSYTQFYISSNGLILFTSVPFSTDDLDPAYYPNRSGDNVAIQDPELPNNFIAAFWDDLKVDTYGKILYTTIGAAPNRKLIIQYTNMGFYPFPANLGTFSVILYETTNRIQIQYRVIVLSSSAKAHGGEATIGLENETGLSGVTYAFNNPTAVNSEQAISFSPVTGPSYTVNPAAVYDGVYLTTNLSLPEPGIPALISPPLNSAIGSAYNFEWGSASNAASYTLYISTDPELIGAVPYPAGSNLSYNITGLTLDRTYYWGVFSKNSTGTTWCEIKRFYTSSAPPLAPVPQTVWTEQLKDKIIKLNYTGGDGSSNTAIITTLPLNGLLYQYIDGIKDVNPISVVPATVSDPGKNIIYSATGGSGNGIGNFKFKIYDNPIESSEATITVNVSPPGVPTVLYIAKSTTLIEIQFDIPMADPVNKHNQFSVTVNPPSSPVTINSANLKEGDKYTIQLILATPIALTDNVLISYTPGTISGLTGGLLLPFTDEPVTLLAQTISFSQSLDKKLSDSPFALSASASSGLGMTFSSSNLSVATVSGNVATFHSIGNSDITARQTGNGTYAPAKYVKTLTVASSDVKTLNLTSVMLQGLYSGGGVMNQAFDGFGAHWPAGVADHITVELHDGGNYSNIIHAASNVELSTSGTATILVPSTYSGNYFITIKHRNSIETTTAAAVSFTGSNISQSFASRSNVYGGNLGISFDSHYLLYSGDVNQDGIVDTGDINEVDNGSTTILIGYHAADVNGDGIVDTSDINFVDNNSTGLVMIKLPY